MRYLRILAFVTCALQPALTQQVGAPTTDLDKVSIDELFSVQVTTVGRKAQERTKAAAIFVVTAEDIRRSGATCIPEALQWVPRLTALHLDGRSWVVSARAQGLPGAILMDARLAWRPTRNGEVSVTVQDLANRRVLECYPEIGGTPATPVRRTYILRRTQRF
jgi:hypothetical protein